MRRICRLMIKKEMKNESHENVWPAAAAVHHPVHRIAREGAE